MTVPLNVPDNALHFERIPNFYGADFDKKHIPQKEIDWGRASREGSMVKQGQIIWLNCNPQIGHEQTSRRGGSRRPALVISNKTFNSFSNLAIVCPITNTNKDYPFHVKLDERTKTKGVVLSDQARTLDIKARNYEIIEKVHDDILLEVIDIINGFIEVEK
jgi:mRNA interferase MazF